MVYLFKNNKLVCKGNWLDLYKFGVDDHKNGIFFNTDHQAWFTTYDGFTYVSVNKDTESLKPYKLLLLVLGEYPNT